MTIKGYTVYCHTNKINGKKYVGITGYKPEERWCNGKGYRNGYFRHAIDKYGWEEFTHELLFVGLSEEEAKQKEIELIAKWDLTNPEKGYNLTNGGDGVSGFHHSEESKAKMSIANIGREWTEEHKKRHSALMTGKKFTEDHKQKLHDANKKNFHPVICTTTGIVYENITAAVKDTEVDRCSIRRICNGKRHMSKGLSFAWYEKEVI